MATASDSSTQPATAPSVTTAPSATAAPVAHAPTTAPAAWAPYRASAAAPWDLRRVVHLHRRAGFAATWNEIQRDLKDSPEASIARLLDGKARLDGVPDDFTDRAAAIGDAAVSSGEVERLQAWWLFRMLF